MPKKFVATCLINFLIAALLGLVLRYAFVGSLPFNYRFLTHAHSHIAMLGWVYLMLFTFYRYFFVPEKKRFYNRLFWVTQFAVIGMLFSFPFQGYAPFSITFSTLHILCSYVFVYKLWKDIQTENKLVKKLVKWSLAFMALSTLGVWCLGPAVGLMGKASAFYQIAIQFFLHFQFNGWFLFAIIAILFYLLQVKSSKQTTVFLRLLIGATFCTLALPIHWFAPHPLLFYSNVIGSLLQVFALIYFIKIVKLPLNKILSKHQKIIKILYRFALSCFILKMALQTVTVIPEFSESLFNHKNFIIGFIHLLMLGVVSGFLLAFLLFSKTIKITTLLYFGVGCFLAGFLLTEVLLTYQGGLYYFGRGLMPHYYLLLFMSSVLLPLGIVLILLTYLKQKPCLKNP